MKPVKKGRLDLDFIDLTRFTVLYAIGASVFGSVIGKDWPIGARVAAGAICTLAQVVYERIVWPNLPTLRRRLAGATRHLKRPAHDERPMKT